MRERLVPLQQLMTARTAMQTSFHHTVIHNDLKCSRDILRNSIAQNTNMCSRQSNILYMKLLSGYFFHSIIISYFLRKTDIRSMKGGEKNRITMKG